MPDAVPSADTESFRRFHTVDLPALIAGGNGALAWADVEPLGCLGLRTPAGSWTFVPRNGTVELVEGEEQADTVVGIDLESWLGLVSDLETGPGLLYGNRLEAVSGNPMRFMRWEPGLRALFHGRPVYDPDTVDLRGLDGGPLDTTAGFSLDDLEGNADNARHFLRTTGYIYVQGAFDSDEVTSMLDDAAALGEEAVPGDQESWWGRNATGDEILTRVLRADSRPRLAALHADPRILRLVATADEPLAAKVEQGTDRVTVLWKHPDMVEGLGDLPWHRDCGMGGHALNCPSVVVTICLNSGAPEAGELRFLPGSHRASFPFVDGTDVAAPEGASLPIATGDMTMHYSDVMHVSLPPTSGDGPHRISVLLAFGPDSAGHHRGERHYNDALLGADDGQVEHIGHRMGTSD
ncbi:MAG: phytanoyl-CoA dioxygenase family protein [Actinobacteria bacterium]|nr:phytanoyl-CoA dioxygenase family protein [Actinomycetota bacterium]